MSYHGKLQTLKNGIADAEIQQWAYQQLEKETVELTDEEILKIFYNIETPRTVSHHKNAIDFARAILRKAQDNG